MLDQIRRKKSPRHSSRIICENVSISYDGTDVVRDVSLNIEPGTFLPFLGANGAGKSTLLRAILGLVKPCRGRIITPFVHHPAGYVPQQKIIDPLFPVSVRQLVAMGLYPRLGFWKRPGRALQKKIDAALLHFALESHQDKTFAELSGGMRQKALLARAFVSEAQVFVMDEPTSEFDETSEQEVLNHLYALNRDKGKTVLIVHHSLDKMACYASQACFMERGRAQILPIKPANCEGA